MPGLQVDTMQRKQMDAHPRLPKTSGAVVVFHALACSRLALLPGLWCKDRVEGRVRARVRAWWEAYVAAVEHPEALFVARSDPPQYPEWTFTGVGG